MKCFGSCKALNLWHLCYVSHWGLLKSDQILGFVKSQFFSVYYFNLQLYLLKTVLHDDFNLRGLNDVGVLIQIFLERDEIYLLYRHHNSFKECYWCEQAFF